MSDLAVNDINTCSIYQLYKNKNITTPEREAGQVGELIKNGVKTNIKEGLVATAGISASLLAANYVAKTGTAQKFITGAIKKAGATKVGKAVINTVKDVATAAAPFVKKAAAWFTALPTPAKVVAIAGAAVTAIALAAIRHKGAKNEGKIEQKYEDMKALNK